MSGSVCTESQPGTGQERGGEGGGSLGKRESCWEQGSAMALVGFVSLHPWSSPAAKYQSTVSWEGARGGCAQPQGGEMWPQGSPGLAKRLCQHNQRLLGLSGHGGASSVPGPGSWGRALAVPISSKGTFTSFRTGLCSTK